MKHLLPSNSKKDIWLNIKAIYCLAGLFICILLQANTVNAQTSTATSSFTTSADTSCSPFSVLFTNTSTGGISYYWEFGDGGTSSSDTTVSHTFSAGTYQVMLIAYDGAGIPDTSYHTIVAKSTPTSSVSDGLGGLFCPGVTDNFFNNGYGYDSLHWIFSDGYYKDSSTYALPHAFSQAGSYNVQLVAISLDGCTDTASMTVTIDTTLMPVLQSNCYVSDTLICPNNSVNFSFYNSGDLTSMMWYFGDGDTSSLSAATHTYAALGNYQVKFVGTNYCGNTDTAYFNVHVVDTLHPSINPMDYEFLNQTTYIYQDSTFTCPNHPVAFNFNHFGYPGTSYKWFFGDGDSSALSNPAHPYASTGVYHANLVVTNHCGNVDTAKLKIYVVDTLKPIVSRSDWNIIDTVVCPMTPITPTLYTTTYDHFIWYFGDGDTSTAINPTHFYQTTGNYQLKLVVSNACGAMDSSMASIAVVDTIHPIASLTVSDTNTICPDEQMTFIGHGGGTYSWNFGDGSPADTMMNATHSYSAMGTYNVMLTVTNNCGISDSASYQVHVDSTGIPNVLFTVSTNNACPQDTIYFYPQDTTMQSYLWHFGDGDSSTQKFPSHAYVNAPQYSTFYPTLTVVNNCGNSGTSSYMDPSTQQTGILVDPSATPVANFSGPTTACAYTPVTFQNLTNSEMIMSRLSDNYTPQALSGLHYVWVFGDGDSAFVMNPTHTYLNPGTYTVKLFASTNCMGEDSALQQITVLPGAFVSGTVNDSNGVIKSGYVYLYQYDTIPGHMPMMQVSAIDTTGAYSFTNIPQGKFLILAKADSATYPNDVPTYYPHQFQWDSATVVNSICDSSSVANIMLMQHVAMNGTGAVSGYVRKGAGYAKVQAQGDPIPGVDVSIEQVPGGSIMITVPTDTNGYYSFQNVPMGSFEIYTDITGLNMAGTYQKTVTVTNNTFTNLNFIADSTTIYPDTVTTNVHSEVTISNAHLTAYPNPYTGYTNISFEVPQKALVKLDVYNVLGEKISTLENKELLPGRYKYRFNASRDGYASSVYFVKLRINKQMETMQIVQIK